MIASGEASLAHAKRAPGASCYVSILSMDEGPSGSSASSDELKRFALIAGAVAAIVSILVGLNVLTGFNPLKRFFHPTPTSSSPSTSAYTSIPPIYFTQSKQFNGQCSHGSCGVSAIFINDGGYVAIQEASLWVCLPTGCAELGVCCCWRAVATRRCRGA